MGLDLEVLLGAWLAAEVNNPDCPWDAHVSDAQLAENVATNDAEVARLGDLARRFPGIVTSIAVGNEATVDWTAHLVRGARGRARRRARADTGLPVTFCENHVPWMGKLDELVPELDFISVHTYPVWEYRTIEEALEVNRADIERIRARFPDVPIAITEAGWTTRSNGRGIEQDNAGGHFQTRYYDQLTTWGEEKGLRVYVFEAFDEPWKGSPDPDEPEKHWGLFTAGGRRDARPLPGLALSAGRVNPRAARWAPRLGESGHRPDGRDGERERGHRPDRRGGERRARRAGGVASAVDEGVDQALRLSRRGRGP